MQAFRTKTSASYRYRIVATLAAVPMLAACGYKGPLYMPPPAPPQESLTTPPQPPVVAPNTDESASTNAQTLPVSAQ